MIRVDDVTKRYGDSTVLDRVSFEAPDGAITGFVGPNGAGKTTTLRVAAGMTQPSEGQVQIGAMTFAQAKRPAHHLGLFLSAEGIPGAMTARGFLEYICDTQGLLRTRAQRLLHEVGLAEVANKKVRSFSLGMRQRLGIGAATVGEPSHLILDEPANGLDPDGIRWFRDFVLSAAQAGVCVILSSHHMRELGAIADQVVMIDSGRIAAQGPIAEFIAAEPQAPVYVETTDDAAAQRAVQDQGLELQAQQNGMMVMGSSPEGLAAVLVGAGVGLTHLTRQRRSLEDTYFSVLQTQDTRH